MRLVLPLAAAAIGLITGPAYGQIAPFDMSPELNLRGTPAPPPAPIVQDPAPQVDAAPAIEPPPAAQPDAAPVPQAPADGPAAAPQDLDVLERHFLPGAGIRLEGEAAERAFEFYLTQAQAAAPATLDLELLNSILVAPEISDLTVTVNDTEITSAPIAFASQPSELQTELPQGVLVPGANRIELAASQRHRTDCSVASTYELWTDIFSTASLLSLSGQGLAQLESVAELAAIGMSPQGVTTLRLFAPGLETIEGGGAALDLVQRLALSTRAVDIDIEVLSAIEPAAASGVLTVILATAQELPDIAASYRAQAEAGPVIGLIDGSVAPNTLLVSGPDWQSIAVAAGSLGGTSALDDLGGVRVDLPNSVPLIEGRSVVSLERLGVDTVQFNGRRYTSSLKFALPGDFYAGMYSQAELILDAAYNSFVLPGSQLDVYVNGQIAAVFPILGNVGGTFRDARLRIPMTNFKPGINEMHVEIILLTREDEICPPGLSGRAAERFLFSSGSQLSFPDFGRIGNFPDLRSLAGTGAPYAGEVPVNVVVESDAGSMRSAMMLLSRMALSSGRAVPVVRVTPETLDPAQPAIVVAPMAALDAPLLERSRLVHPDEMDFSTVGAADSALEQWRQTSGDATANPWERFRSWIADRVDLRPENFWLIRRADGAYVPQSTDAAILTQSVQPEGGIWTYLTIPQADMFAAAVDRLVAPDVWQDVAGRVSAIGPDDEGLLVLQPRERHLVPTQPWSFGNLRLIAANWLSTNVLAYALVLAIVAVLLTLATTLLLNTRGVRNK